MIFTVVWKPSAERELARIWMQVADKAAVSWAANAIDQALRIDPHLKGRPHLGTRRSFLQPPLGVIYEISEQDRVVRVLVVMHFDVQTGNGQQ